jgi:hypothetical protein
MSIYLQTAIEDAIGLAQAASGSMPVTSTPSSGPAADAIRVRDYIKATARTRAAMPRSVSTGSMLYRRLTDFYLKEYLAAPTPERGRVAAEEKIGKAFAGPADPKDKWEVLSLRVWNRQPIPGLARLLDTDLPPVIASATDIMSIANRGRMPYIDVPQLVGAPNLGTGTDADLAGGKNISHLMHWGTGVKYSNVEKMALRQLFLGYELWHLEAWDVFGEDPINDLMVEEAGRLLGVQLRAGTVTTANLQATLNAAFDEARAWVGTLLRSRQSEFDRWIVAETQKPAMIHWVDPDPIWRGPTIHGKLLARESVEAVKRSELVERIIDIQAVIYSADVWEAAHGRIDNGVKIPLMLSGAMDVAFAAMAKLEYVRSQELAAGLQAPIEGYRSDAQGTACATGPQPGAKALVSELQKRVGGRGEIFNCRSVRGETRLSLHAEGRAVDWYRDARDPAQASEAQQIIDWLLNADADGNRHAVARRMGVQELIWNRSIWTARRHAEGWRPYTGVNPHTDHLHIGLNWAGAKLQTSHWSTPN